MIWNIQFSRSRYATWLSPGYHTSLKKMVGKTISTTTGVQARMVKLEFNIEWKHCSKKEKMQLKQQFGDEVKNSYHRFTRATLDKTIYEQTLLPCFE